MLMRICEQVHSVDLNAPSIQLEMGQILTSDTVGLRESGPLSAHECTRGRGIGARASGSFKSSLCDLVKSSTLSRPQCSQRQNGDNNELAFWGLYEDGPKRDLCKACCHLDVDARALPACLSLGKLCGRHFLSVRKPSFSFDLHAFAHLGTSYVVWLRDGKLMDHEPSSTHRCEFS